MFLPRLLPSRLHKRLNPKRIRHILLKLHWSIPRLTKKNTLARFTKHYTRKKKTQIHTS